LFHFSQLPISCFKSVSFQFYITSADSLTNRPGSDWGQQNRLHLGQKRLKVDFKSTSSRPHRGLCLCSRRSRRL